MNKKRVLSIFAILLVVALGLSVQTVFADNGNPPGQTKIMTRPEGASGPIGAPAAYPPLPTPLISNLSPGTSSGVAISSTAYMAAGFTTPATGSYTIGSARLNLISSDNSCNLYAYIYSDNAGVPGSAVATFTPLYVAAFNNWDAEFDIFLTAPYTLSASTTYWLVWNSDCPVWTPFWGQDDFVAPSGIFTYVMNLDNFGGGWQLPMFGGYKKWALYPALPAVSLNPTSIDFGDQLVGSTSAAQTVTVTNTGGADLHIGLLSFTSDWILSNDTCSNTTVIPAGTCTFDVAFHPLALGPLTGSITIPSDAPSSPDIVSLSGNGVQPAVGLSATSLEFGNILVGTTSPAQTITLTNTGTTVLTFTVPAFQIGTPFEATTDCGTTLDPGASCHFYVTFSPMALGYIATNLMIYTDAPSTPDLIPVYGTGVAVPDGTNLLKKPDFPSATIFPTPWQLFGVIRPFSSAIDCTVFQSSACSVVFNSGNRSALQRVARSGLAGDTYFFGLSSSALNVPVAGKYRVEVVFLNSFNHAVGTANLNFTPGTHTWETVSGYAKALGNYKSIVFRFYYQNPTGRAWFDDAFLIVAK